MKLLFAINLLNKRTVKSVPILGYFCFSFFSSTFFAEIVVFSWIETRWSRRRVRWPLDHHLGSNKKTLHYPVFKFWNIFCHGFKTVIVLSLWKVVLWSRWYRRLKSLFVSLLICLPIPLSLHLSAGSTFLCLRCLNTHFSITFFDAKKNNDLNTKYCFYISPWDSFILLLSTVRTRAEYTA